MSVPDVISGSSPPSFRTAQVTSVSLLVVSSIYAAAFEAAAAQLPVVNPYRIIHPLLHDFLMVCTETQQTSESIT